MVRRTKEEVRTELPKKNRMDVWTTMSKDQKRQHDLFAKEAEIRLMDLEEEGKLTATSILAEYTRLRQFAIAKQKLVMGVPYPTSDSGKLEQLKRILDEHDITTPDMEEGGSTERAVIFSQFSKVVDMLHRGTARLYQAYRSHASR